MIHTDKNKKESVKVRKELGNHGPGPQPRNSSCSVRLLSHHEHLSTSYPRCGSPIYSPVNLEPSLAGQTFVSQGNHYAPSTLPVLHRRSSFPNSPSSHPSSSSDGRHVFTVPEKKFWFLISTWDSPPARYPCDDGDDLAEAESAPEGLTCQPRQCHSADRFDVWIGICARAPYISEMKTPVCGSNAGGMMTRSPRMYL
ncbi:hypothetical protein BDN67DRAFT_971879 [Paxillus ammoniavirescens]|nr:hypothetical protein BDN67DRAFT_971879 [Paxillus ammoniavirescens]